VTYGTGIIYTVSAAYNVPRFFEQRFFSMEIPWECQLVDQCFREMKGWATGFYLPVFYWFRVICVNVLPCLCLVVLNSLLVRELRIAQANRKRLFQERKQESKKQRDSNGTTMMLVRIPGCEADRRLSGT
jgi:hypothetical protein